MKFSVNTGTHRLSGPADSCHSRIGGAAAQFSSVSWPWCTTLVSSPRRTRGSAGSLRLELESMLKLGAEVHLCGLCAPGAQVVVHSCMLRACPCCFAILQRNLCPKVGVYAIMRASQVYILRKWYIIVSGCFLERSGQSTHKNYLKVAQLIFFMSVNRIVL